MSLKMRPGGPPRRTTTRRRTGLGLRRTGAGTGGAEVSFKWGGEKMVSNSWWMSMRMRGALLALAIGVGVLLSARAAPAASVGHSGWFWGNPLPQGNTLSGIDFAGARGY